MKKVLLAGLCGLSLMAACVLTATTDSSVSTAGNGGYVHVRV